MPRTNTQKSFTFYHRGLDCESRELRDTLNNRQLWPGVQNEAGQELTEFCQENTLVIENTFSNNPRDDTARGKSGRLYSLPPKMEKLYTVSKNKLTVAQIMSSLLQN